MKVYMGKYPRHWTTNNLLHDYYMKRYGTTPINPDALDRTVKCVLRTINRTVCRKLNEWNSGTRKIEVHIDPWDYWNVDNTLAHIIAPLLKKYKAELHGAPNTDDADVPEYLRSTACAPKENEWDTDENWFKRWDWIVDELIWTFEQKAYGSENQFYHHLPQDAKVPEGWQWVDGFKITEGFWVDRPSEIAYHARIENGLRLFGKYYQSLWD